MEYKAIYSNLRAGLNTVNIDVRIYQRENEDSPWHQMYAEREMSISSSQVIEIYNDDEMGEAEKISALNQILLDQIEDWGVVTGQEARAALEELVPQWPVTVNL